ncbi:hypothetical protein [Streptomyces sparsus]
MPTRTAKRSRSRRAAQSAFGLLLLAKNAVMGLAALLLLAAGVWTSWDSAQHTMLTTGREQGTMTVASCEEGDCTGPFVPTAGRGSPRVEVTLDESLTRKTGEQLSVVLRPGTDSALRTGPAGILHSWMPLAGALLLAALVVAGGLRMRRTAWTLALLGGALMAGTFTALQL